ncbi:MAG: NAD(P)-dependent glycerol-3-phosphate dehydrogenase [Armatimonadetes bacterium]|nr:NAD(P)-dependent glycerol-3-phosphate dehydrogenase [Armatimonadota bacterium]
MNDTGTIGPMTVSVVGAGSWGTAMALVLARNGRQVRLFGRPSDALNSLGSRRENLRYLPGFVLPEDVEIADLGSEKVLDEVVVVAVPSSAVQEVLPGLARARVIVVASKGLAPGGEALLSDVIADKCPGANIVVLSGPNLAVELAKGVPTAAVAASTDEESACLVRDAFHCRTYRVYLSDDVKGVETAGALKNVMAIAAGMSDGLGFGDNTKGALLARGLNEMARVGLALGARMETFLGIAGVGDLFATANSRLSRNYRVGFGLGEGRSLEAILGEIGQVAEGVPTADAALLLARRLGIDVPIIDVVHLAAKGEIDPRSAVWQLMERTPKREGLSSGRPASAGD